MEGRDELLTISEIAIAIAGFSGVVAAFLQSDGLHELDRTRFINLFVVSFSAVGLAFAPIALYHAGLHGAVLWRCSSAIMLIAWVANSAMARHLVQPAIREHVPAEQRRAPRAIVGIPALANFFVQLFNLLGWPWEPNFLALLFGLFVYLVAAGALFVYIILFRPPAI